MGTTRTTLRRSIGRLCGDLIVLTGTAVGTTSTFIDTTNGVAGDGALAGRVAYYVTGHASNIGLLRRVSDNTESTGTVTVSVAWPQASAVSDVLELFGSRRVSPSVDEIHDKINDCIRAVADENLIIVDSSDATFDAESPYIDIPSGWIGVTGAQWQDSLSEWHDIPKADWKLHRNLGTRGQVELLNMPRWWSDTRSVHLVGVTPAAVLTTDSGETTIAPDWITKQAAGELLIQNARHYEQPSEAERRGNLWLQQAASLRQTAQTRPPANFVRTNRS
jgi:hypothetical protein